MKNSSIYDHLAKVLLIGESGAGKTCLLQRFCSNEFTENHLATIAIDFKTKLLDVDGVTLKMQLWDTAGQEKFSTLTSGFFKGSHGILVVYSIADRNSFDSVGKWMQQIEFHAPKTVKIVLVGNKCDLEEDREVNAEEGRNLAKKHKALFFETSAFDGTNVDEAFGEIGSLVLEDYQKQSESLRNIRMPNKKSGCC